MKFATLLIALGVSGLGAALVTGASAQEKLTPEHYQCYSVVDPKPFKQRTVTLVDQFGKSRTAAVKPLFLCTPVSKNEEPVPDKLTHLMCYQIVGRRAADKRVVIENQFGREDLTVGLPRMICVPSTKRVAG